MEAGVPTTLQEAVTYFADKQVAHDFFVAIRFPNGVACPRHGCGSADVVTIKNRREWRCRECKRQFSVKVGTIFESSPIGFDKWLPALWLLTANRNGISSYEVARGLGVTQKTAWFMMHRLRLALKDGSAEPFAGEVEADETYVGGKTKATKVNVLGQRKLAHGPGTGKTTVFGMVERATSDKPSRVRAIVVPDHKAKTLLPLISTHVVPGSVLYTDALRSYREAKRDYEHYFIDHTLSYVEGRVTTNRIENLLVVLEADAARHVHLPARLSPRPLPGRAGLPLQRAR